jgi:hypothetical protein
MNHALHLPLSALPETEFCGFELEEIKAFGILKWSGCIFHMRTGIWGARNEVMWFQC